MDIQWYPGHMTKSRRMMEENIGLVDVVIELLDARIPLSSKNPDIDRMARNKRRIIVLNKSDLADAEVSKQWEEFFLSHDWKTIQSNASTGAGLTQIMEAARVLMQDKLAREKKRGRIFVPIRAMIVGIPNVGKSTLINRYVGKSAAKTGDRPGVTRGRQWVKIKKDFELLDTPGILWPKFEDEQVGISLALTGAIDSDRLLKTELASALISILCRIKPEALTERYRITYTDESPLDILQKIGEARGFKIKGGDIDLERAAITLLGEFREGRLGRISLERP